ncbi:MAG: DUF4982 domain-containing protein [Verrucomicrobia bacterium]|jgi:beta-galactosidase|nr:DUF4982 domain-containing protein [Verrucomicrobiota bacterium]
MKKNSTLYNQLSLFALFNVILFITVNKTVEAQPLIENSSFNPENASDKSVLDLSGSWDFCLDPDNGEIADTSGFQWTTVVVPHDWSWEGGPRPDGAQKDRGGYRIGGVGWYRKNFVLPPAMNDRRILLQFDGVYRNSTVYINDRELGTRPYGYLSFAYDISDNVIKGENTIHVRVDNSLEPSTRWYHPSGIYAPVRITASHPRIRIDEDSLVITTPAVSSESATVEIKANFPELAPDYLSIRVIGPDGGIVKIWNINEPKDLHHRFELDHPALWSPESPSLYRVVLSLFEDGESMPVDQYRQTFGIRSVEWDARQGLILNGKRVKIRGVCEHLTGGPVGGAWSPELLEWKLKLIRSMGANAIRTAHNPHTPEFYEICDRLGFLVLNEAFDGWKQKAEQDYGALHFEDWWHEDLGDFIRRDRNHPCVIAWSVGNETEGDVSEALVARCHELDPTRLVTSGAAGTDTMDIVGINGFSERKSFFATGPFDRPFLATEAPHTWQVRGYYNTRTWYRNGYPNEFQDPFFIPNLAEEEVFSNAFLSPNEMANAKQVFNSSYDNATVRITARQHWEKSRDLDWISGFFRWTGFDYPGEAGFVHGGWPFHAFAGGCIDLAGFPKDLYFFYQSQWTDEPMVHILPHWTHPTMEVGKRIPVHVYTNAAEVELFLNEQSLGVDKPGKAWNEMQCEWSVPWRPGELTAVARDEDGRVVATRTVATAGPPDGLDVDFESIGDRSGIFTVRTVDAFERLYPYGENRVFAAHHPSLRILSFENGHPGDVDPPVAHSRRAFMGLVRVFVEDIAAIPQDEVGITLGAILGERRQLTSNHVSIDVRRFTASGEELPTNDVEVFYTVDGEMPSARDVRYEASFSIPSRAVVKAVVYENGVEILRMEESFGPGLGLHWEETDGATH